MHSSSSSRATEASSDCTLTRLVHDSSAASLAICEANTQVIPLSDVGYWSQYYKIFASATDVYSLISVQDGASRLPRSIGIFEIAAGSPGLSQLTSSPTSAQQSAAEPVTPDTRVIISPLHSLAVFPLPNVQYRIPAEHDTRSTQLSTRARQGARGRVRE